MADYHRIYDSRHLQADCHEPGSAPEPYARQENMGYLYLALLQITPGYNYQETIANTSHQHKGRNTRADTVSAKFVYQNLKIYIYQSY